MSAMRRVRIQVFLSLLLATTILTPTETNALPTFNYAPATIWGHIYASDTRSNFLTTTPPLDPLEGEIKSEWNVQYKNFPDNARQAVQYAINIWSRNFSSKVPINVEASWEPSKNSQILGSARAGYYFNSFPGSPDDDLWYPSALANRLAQRDLDPKQSEILLNINSSAQDWYLGTDGKPPTNRYDLASVVLHEIAHGLGFMSNAQYDRDSKTAFITQPTPFDAYVQLPDGKTIMNFCSKSSDLGQAMINQLSWFGEFAITANKGTKPKLYTPNPFVEGSSIAHLDETTFDKHDPNTVMTPNMDTGEVFNAPGPIILAMIEDMLRKPPAIKATGIPQAPLNLKAIIGDKYAILTFDAPECRRIDKVQKYKVTINPIGEVREFKSSPFRINGLKNDTSYTFSVVAENSFGTSTSVTSNSIQPQSTPKAKLIDSNSKVTNLASTTFREKPTIIYNDTSTNKLKMATYQNMKWKFSTIRKGVQVGKISICKSGRGSKETLHVFYGEYIRKDLMLSIFDGKRWDNQTVDGNGQSVQDYKEPERRRTSSNVSISNGCAVTKKGLHVFYRDESQGILLGALYKGEGWEYEIVDGDLKSDGRTIGDVAFNLSVTSLEDQVYLLYDSVLSMHSNNVISSGEVRLAIKNVTVTQNWHYKTLDGSNSVSEIAGFATALAATRSSVKAAWLSARNGPINDPTSLKFVKIIDSELIKTMSSFELGEMGYPIRFLRSEISFACEKRLCGTSSSHTYLINPHKPITSSGDYFTLGDRIYFPIAVNLNLRLIRTK